MLDWEHAVYGPVVSRCQRLTDAEEQAEGDKDSALINLK